MNLKAKAFELVSATDRAISAAQVGIFERTDGLITLFAHSLFEDEREINSQSMNPQERLSVKEFTAAIEYFLSCDYKIVSIEDVANGAGRGQKSLLLTFDDGYSNNHRALPILKHFKATAVIFLSTNHVLEQRPYWWDVLYRIRRGQGRTETEIARECFMLNTKQTGEIESYVQQASSTVPFKPLGELDRPFTPDEIRELHASGHFRFENHTANHAVLTAYGQEEIFRELSDAQNSVEKMTGRRPIALAYPNGLFNSTVIDCARRAGLKLGFSGIQQKEYASAFTDPSKQMALGRFHIWGSVPMAEQCRFFRSDLMLTQRLRRIKRGL